MNKIVGKNIRYYRTQKGLSQKEAALLAGITPSYLGYLERGQKNPSVNLIEKLSDVLGVQTYVLFMGSPEENLTPDLLHLMYAIRNMKPKHREFLYMVIKEYIRIHHA